MKYLLQFLFFSTNKLTINLTIHHQSSKSRKGLKGPYTSQKFTDVLFMGVFWAPS